MANTRFPLFAAASAIVLSAACAESVVAPTAPPAAFGLSALEYDNPYGKFKICKEGTDASFSVQVAADAPVTVSVNAGECLVVAAYRDSTAEGLTVPTRVMVTELFSAETRLDSILKDSLVLDTAFSVARLTGTATVSGILTYGKGVTATFFNSPLNTEPPARLEGCTPGYWRQSRHFDSWPAPYAPNTAFSSVFANAFPGKSLHFVLTQKGGGLKALGRHTVAALLNAASDGVNYERSVAQVIAAFNSAVASRNYTALHRDFKRMNEKGCPLN